MFVDSDDAITDTALEEIYGIAKKFDVDVVHCEKCYRAPGETVITDKKFLQEFTPLGILQPTDFVTKPTLMSENLAKRLEIFAARKFDWSTWQNFIRRDFVIKNEIKFPNYKVQEDTIFSFFLLTLAEKIVRVPNIFYVYRYRDDSACRFSGMAVEEQVKRWGYAFFTSIPLLEKFMNNLDFFVNQRDYKYLVFDAIFNFVAFNVFIPLYAQIPAAQLYEIICTELKKIENTTELTAFLFSRLNVLNVNLFQQSQIIQQQQAQIQQLQEKIRQLEK